MSSCYDNDIDPRDGEVLFSLVSPSGIENEIRALTIDGCPFYYATVRKVEVDPDGFIIYQDVRACYNGEGLWVWSDLQTAIETVNKWR